MLESVERLDTTLRLPSDSDCFADAGKVAEFVEQQSRASGLQMGLILHVGN